VSGVVIEKGWGGKGLVGVSLGESYRDGDSKDGSCLEKGFHSSNLGSCGRENFWSNKGPKTLVYLIGGG